MHIKYQQKGFSHIGLIVVFVALIFSLMFFAYQSWQRQESQATIDNGGGSSSGYIRVASYNILGSGAKAAASFNKKYGTNNVERTSQAAKIIDQHGVAIVGFQEVNKEQNQHKQLRRAMAKRGYDSYPKNLSANDRSWMRPIYWKKAQFEKIKTGILKYPWQDAPNLARKDGAPGVLLKEKTTGKYYTILNIHMIAYNTDSCRYKCNPPGTKGGSDSGGAEKRKKTAEVIRTWTNSLKKNTRIVVMGDMNSAMVRRVGPKYGIQFDEAVSRSGLPYCVLSSGLLRHAYDAAQNKSGSCPSMLSVGTARNEDPIDQLYVSWRTLKVVKSPYSIRTKLSQKTSDHLPRVMLIDR